MKSGCSVFRALMAFYRSKCGFFNENSRAQSICEDKGEKHAYLPYHSRPAVAQSRIVFLKYVCVFFHSSIMFECFSQDGMLSLSWMECLILVSYASVCERFVVFMESCNCLNTSISFSQQEIQMEFS